MNIFMGMGRLTRDFEVSNSGKAAWSAVAIDRRKKDEDGNTVTDFIPVRVLGEKAVASVTKWLSKGKKIGFSGELQINQYQDQDGNKKTSTYVIMNNWEFADSKGVDSTNTGFEPVQETPFAQPTSQSGSGFAPKQSPSGRFEDGFSQIPDFIEEELPFV